MEKLFYISKFLFIVGSVLLISISSIRFSLGNINTMHQFIINLYYLVLGVVTGLSQLIGHKQIAINIRFLNYYWGKFLYSLFLASMTFGTLNQQHLNIQLFEWLITVYFLMCAGLWVLLSVLDRDRDLRQNIIDDKDIQEQEEL